MPRKRASSTSLEASESSGASAAKQAKTGKKAPAKKAKAPGDRWSKVSGSRNAAQSYLKITANLGEKVTEFEELPRIPLCTDDFDDFDDEDEDEDDDDESEKENAPAAKKAHPQDKNKDGKDQAKEKERAKNKNGNQDGDRKNIVISKAGVQKAGNVRVMCSLRDDTYGQMEVIQNLFLDYAEARTKTGPGEWWHQWAIIEATAIYFNNGVDQQIYMGVDDAEFVAETMTLVARMFLDAFARLQRDNLLGPDSPVKSVPFMLAYVLLLNKRCALFYDVIGDHNEDRIEQFYGAKKTKKTKDAAGAGAGAGEVGSFSMKDWTKYLCHYAVKNNYDSNMIPKLGSSKQSDADLYNLPDEKALEAYALPPSLSDATTADDDDPWNWTSELAEYRRDHRVKVGSRNDIGGDYYDITAERRPGRGEVWEFQKDPLSKQERAALKAGMVLELA